MKKRKFYLLYDLVFVTGSFLFMAWLKPATKRIVLPTYFTPFLIFLLIWLIISLLSDKYNISKKKKLRELITPIIRSDFTILSIVIVLIFTLKVDVTSRLMVLGTILLAFMLEFIFALFYYYHRKLETSNDSSAATLKPTAIEQFHLSSKKKEIELELPQIENIQDSIYPNLKDRYLANIPALFSFINDTQLKEKLHLFLDRIPKDKSLILDSHTFFNIENIDYDSLVLFINLHKINDIRRINKYFIQTNKNLKYGGYFIGCGETISEHRRKFFIKYPRILAFIFYYIDFILKRIIPKLPMFKEIYFAITKGENRTISTTEILGRLYFCGFEVLHTTEINNLLYFIARKINIPEEKASPSYGPFIKMKRVGKDGKIFNVYKLRTMHPYSEYLQDYIHTEHQLADGGKFRNDPRLTGWGKLLRKFFIDELPQLINLFRDELDIVGVRALSEHYFNLYPKDLQKLRTNFKPGLVPPYYADIPSSFDEILKSERNYLTQKEKHPFRTDAKYFFKACFNIIFKKARSR